MKIAILSSDTLHHRYLINCIEKEGIKISKYIFETTSIKSKFKNSTFMLHSEEFYSSNNFKLGINFYLPKNFYSYAIKECHKKNKKLGLAVCDAKTFSEISDIKFDFYKLLSIAINEKDLIKHLKKKKKPVFISTGHKVRDKEILNCINEFKSKKKSFTPSCTNDL